VLEKTRTNLLSSIVPNNISLIEKDISSVVSYGIGPGLVFQRLWESLGLPGIFEGLLRGRKFKFSVERAVFLCSKCYFYF
jgi:hypothetical protein